ncbi:hypothetical protein CANARDRAFT_21697 [[Candida] arabinofermentans NRRL YB-2248]|uniref:2-dehydropantolactone reductase n=1 Tax=[Candida] arabinofermentans NRRL YB-2248 TaxID=983967 RepID=A0A1E4T4L6_9ASCO|nr:hypothetical protein CANARDRAFT_21697 [[Candida] arabinofermentans NRRL YB-2248]
MSPAKFLTLNNGKKISSLGLGTWELTNAYEIVKAGLKVGYRTIDTASMYMNERECGEAIVDWIAEDPANNKREDVYYITKLWNDENGYEVAKKAIARCMERVKGLKYIDLLLIHSPLEGPTMRLETYKAMQEAVDSGIVKSIGVSNYGIAHVDELLNWPGLKYKPVVNEIEVSPWCMRQELIDHCKSKGLDIIAFCPFSHAQRINDPDALAIAKKHGVTSAQVLVRWSLQKGYIPLPKTKTLSRLATNFDVYSFELSEEDIKQLDHPNVHDPSDWEVTTCP